MWRQLELVVKIVVIACLLGEVVVAGQILRYEGETVPTQSQPPWAVFRSEGLLGVHVVSDAETDDGFALELDTGGDSGNFSQSGSSLDSIDNSLGWRLQVRHNAIVNSGETINHFKTNDDSDHLRFFDGVRSVVIDFRPGEVRVHSTPSAQNVGRSCQDFPDSCRFWQVPHGEYVEVTVIGVGHNFTVQVNDSSPWTGVSIARASGDPFLGFGNFSASGRLSSLARWDFIRLDMRSAAPVVTCSGFQSPLDAGPVTVGKNRALPLKAELFDGGGLALSDLDILALPVLQVLFDPAGGGDAVDVTDEASPAGQGTDGNQFVFSDGLWRFNLKTKNYSAAGTYSMTMVSGDESEYLVEGCSAQFVIDP